MLKTCISTGCVGRLSGPLLAELIRQRGPEQQRFAGKREARAVDDFFWDVERYMEDSGVRDDAGKIRMASRYLCDDALVETVQSRRQGGYPHGRDVVRLQARVQTPVLSWELAGDRLEEAEHVEANRYSFRVHQDLQLLDARDRGNVGCMPAIVLHGRLATMGRTGA